MKTRNIISKSKCTKETKPTQTKFFLKCFFLFSLFCVLLTTPAYGQDEDQSQNSGSEIQYDQINVKVAIENYGYCNLDVLYSADELLYINISDLFRNLEIPCFLRNKGDSLKGFLGDESRPYSIDFNTKQVVIAGKTIHCKKELIKDMGSVYMESSLFSELFGITLKFNFRALSIMLKSDFELPFVKKMRLEKMRTNISKIKNEVVADTIVKRDYHLFRFGILDWSLSSFQRWGETVDNRLGLGIGTELLFGEAEVSLSIYNKEKFDKRQLQYIWRWVDNDKSLIRQAQVGKISNQNIAFINAPVIGAIIRNTPTTVRKANGFYTINEFTEPNWTVELYINNNLVDFTKADANGSFLFKVPIVYGFTTLKLKFYGPLGEERTEERTINVPYSIMPTNELEYTLSAGIVDDTNRAISSKAELNYGVNRFLTVGGGMEYLSSLVTGAYIPFAKVTIQPFSKLTFNAEYAQGVRVRGLLNYYFWKSASLSIDYTRYVKGQRATIFNASEERKARLSLPFNIFKIGGFAKIDFTQLVYDKFSYKQGSVMISAYYRQFSANSSTQFNFLDNKLPLMNTDLALSYRVGKGFVLRSSVQYDLNKHQFMTCKAEFEKTIRNGSISVSYANNIMYNDSYFNFNFKYDLPFARTNISASQNKVAISTAESAQGSMAYAGGDKPLHVSNNSSAGKGGITLYPFLDLNGNGKFDKSERLLKLRAVKIGGGQVKINEKDSVVQIPDLNSFIYYTIEFTDNDLESISWRFKKKIYSVLINPNQFKRVDVPIITVGEVSGMAYIKSDNSLKGIGRILVKFYKKGSDKEIAETLSESDGYIDYLGFAPGDYTARVDSVQLNNLEFISTPPEINFTIKSTSEGDIVEGIQFVLSKKQIVK